MRCPPLSPFSSFFLCSVPFARFLKKFRFDDAAVENDEDDAPPPFATVATLRNRNHPQNIMNEDGSGSSNSDSSSSNGGDGNSNGGDGNSNGSDGSDSESSATSDEDDAAHYPIRRVMVVVASSDNAPLLHRGDYDARDCDHGCGMVAGLFIFID